MLHLSLKINISWFKEHKHIDLCNGAVAGFLGRGTELLNINHTNFVIRNVKQNSVIEVLL
jgi:hypothetical protein